MAGVARLTPTEDEAKVVEGLILAYRSKREHIERFLGSVVAILQSESLKPFAHSIKARLKDEDHLRDKLLRKMRSAGAAFDITPDNLLQKVTDLAGARFLHLHTKQMKQIDPIMKHLFELESVPLFEVPFARSWDDENKEFFGSIGIKVEDSKTLYTSVHYVVSPNSKKNTTCEIQVRTLSEEVWGEVDHAINYPHKTPSVACQEQILTLARVTSSATRLVDSIFASVNEYDGFTKA